MKIKTCQKQCVQANDFRIWFFSTMAFIRVESVLIRGFKILIAASPRCDTQSSLCPNVLNVFTFKKNTVLTLFESK